VSRHQARLSPRRARIPPRRRLSLRSRWRREPASGMPRLSPRRARIPARLRLLQPTRVDGRSRLQGRCGSRRVGHESPPRLRFRDPRSVRGRALRCASELQPQSAGNCRAHQQRR
jgi:hypothetical protein